MKETKPGAIIIEGHVQGLSNTRSLGEKGIPVIVLDKQNCIARYSKYCRKFFKCPDYQSDEFIPFLINLNKDEKLDGWLLLPSNDHITLAIAENKDLLAKFYKVITEDLSTVKNIYNKERFLNIAKKATVPFPNTIYPISSNLNEFHLFFPVIIKGKEGLTFYKTLGKKAFLCANKKELNSALTQIEKKLNLSNVFVQEVIKNSLYKRVCSFTAFSIKGEIKTYWIGEKIREHPLDFGTATYTRSVKPNETLELGRRIIKELNYTGTCEIEFIRDEIDKKYKIIEMNARTWLWVGLAKASGIDYALYMYNYVNGIETNYPVTFTANKYWMNLWTDLLFSIKAIAKKKNSLKDYLNVFKEKPVQAVLSRKDIKPFIYMTLTLPIIAARRSY